MAGTFDAFSDVQFGMEKNCHNSVVWQTANGPPNIAFKRFVTPMNFH